MRQKENNNVNITNDGNIHILQNGTLFMNAVKCPPNAPAQMLTWKYLSCSICRLVCKQERLHNLYYKKNQPRNINVKTRLNCTKMSAIVCKGKLWHNHTRASKQQMICIYSIYIIYTHLDILHNY